MIKNFFRFILCGIECDKDIQTITHDHCIESTITSVYHYRFTSIVANWAYQKRYYYSPRIYSRFHELMERSFDHLVDKWANDYWELRP